MIARGKILLYPTNDKESYLLWSTVVGFYLNESKILKTSCNICDSLHVTVTHMTEFWLGLTCYHMISSTLFRFSSYNSVITFLPSKFFKWQSFINWNSWTGLRNYSEQLKFSLIIFMFQGPLTLFSMNWIDGHLRLRHLNYPQSVRCT